VQVALDILAILAAYVGGLFAGLKVGALVRGRPASYWTLNIVAGLVCLAGDYVGLVLGLPWLALGSIGLLAGTISGLKYGYSDNIAVWRTPAPSPERAAEPLGDEQPAAEPADAD
jgi:hypothetical protein